MKRVLVDDLGGEVAVVEGERLHHLARVLRAAVGERVEVFDGKGGCREGTLAELGPEEARIVLGPWKQSSTTPPITLGVGLLKGDKFDWVVQKATELGVATIVPLRLERCVVRLDGPKAAQRTKRWVKIAEEAARQSGRSDVPAVEVPADLSTFLARASERGEQVGLLWEEQRSGPRLGEWVAGQGGPIGLVVGPEGGITEAEVDQVRRAGGVPLDLGPQILRAETAAIVSLALALHELGALG